MAQLGQGFSLLTQYLKQTILMDTVVLDIARDWTVYAYDVGPRGSPSWS